MAKRTWIITGEITHDDLEWILRSKLAFEQGKQHYIDFRDIGTRNYVKVTGRLDPSKIITTNEQEETWLKMYFADRAILLEQ